MTRMAEQGIIDWIEEHRPDVSVSVGHIRHLFDDSEMAELLLAVFACGAAMERGACAEICEAHDADVPGCDGWLAAQTCAEKIRKRDQS